MHAVDTNVLIYAHDPRDAAKQATAVSLMQSLTPGVLLWQVACEYLSASHKLEPRVTAARMPGKIFGICVEFGLPFFPVGVSKIRLRSCWPNTVFRFGMR